MLKIAFCESHYRAMAIHLNDNGTRDFGPFQVNEIHRQTALKRGLDIEDPIDNIKYARLLFEKNGTRDWNASKKCWGAVSDG